MRSRLLILAAVLIVPVHSATAGGWRLDNNSQYTLRVGIFTANEGNHAEWLWSENIPPGGNGSVDFGHLHAAESTWVVVYANNRIVKTNTMQEYRANGWPFAIATFASFPTANGGNNQQYRTAVAPIRNQNNWDVWRSTIFPGLQIVPACRIDPRHFYRNYGLKFYNGYTEFRGTYQGENADIVSTARFNLDVSKH